MPSTFTVNKKVHADPDSINPSYPSCPSLKKKKKTRAQLRLLFCGRIPFLGGAARVRGWFSFTRASISGGFPLLPSLILGLGHVHKRRPKSTWFFPPYDEAVASAIQR